MAFGMKRPALLLAAVALVGVAASGCTNNASGQAVPPATGSGGTGASVPQSTAPPSTSQSGGSALDAIDPCSLLTADEVSQFSARPGVPKNSGGARSCDWTIPDGRGTFG